ncbi:MAG: cohesin domain-containing protein, partial [Patescibacteria group bacterium]
VTDFEDNSYDWDKLSFGGSGTTGGGISGAKERFKKIIQPNFSVRGDYNILAELTTCPNPNKAGPTNCVITENFRQAVANNMTVGEAMKQGYLNANGIFGFISSNSDKEPSYEEMKGYPYRSMIILRKFRIIPVGWEAAAKLIKSGYTENQSVSSISEPTFKIAQAGSATLTAGTASGNAGTAVTIPITLAGVPAGTASIVNFDLTYDPVKLNFPTGDINKIVKGSALGSANVSVIAGESSNTISITLVEMNDPLGGVIPSGQILQVKFNILSTALAGNTPITFSNPAVIAKDNSNMNISATGNGTVTVGTGPIIPPPPPGNNYINSSATLDKAYNLGDMVNCFDAADDYEGYYSDWCKGLVDPNWVLKAPLNYCKREGPGPEITNEQITGSGDDSELNISRKDNYCGDEQSCIK